MSWFWSSSKPASAPAPTSQEPPQPSPAHQEPSVPKPPQTREEIADAEFKSLWESLEADIKPSSTKYNRVSLSRSTSSTSPSTSSPTSSTPEAEPKPELSLADSLLLTELSCRALFDSAFYCQSLGGQFNALYRTGSIQSCSAHWSDFWFCMRTRSLGKGVREEMVREYWKKKERAKYDKSLGRQSSEDVWEGREGKVEPGSVWQVREEEVESLVGGVNGGDEAWREREREQRRKFLEEREKNEGA